MIETIENKRDWILIFLDANNREPIESSVRLMKQLFLFKQSMTEQLKNFYEFKPYLYGPCSFEVYKDIDILEKEGLIEKVSDPRKNFDTFYLTNKGKKHIEKIITKIPKEVSKIKKQVNSMSFLSLLEYVYNKYPSFAKNSIINLR